MALPLSSTSTVGSEQESQYARLNTATSAEQQMAIMAAYLQTQENAYNSANPTEAPKERVSFIPDFETNQASVTADLLMTEDAALGSPTDSIRAHIPA